MHRAGGEQKKHFRNRRPVAAVAVYQQGADFFGFGGAARLARGHDGPSFCLQAVGQQPYLRGLAAPLAALEGNEKVRVGAVMCLKHVSWTATVSPWRRP